MVGTHTDVQTARVTAQSLLARIDSCAGLNSEEQFLLEHVRDLVDTQIAPDADGFDNSSDFPWKNIERINALGLSAMFIPAEYGGTPLSYAAYLATLREISRGCASTGLIWATNFHATNPLVDFASQDQLRRFLPVIANGGLAAIAITEASGGSDATGMTTRFAPGGEEIVIDGEKTYITNGDVADIILVLGKWEPLGTGRDAISAAVVPRGTTGLEVRRREKKLGHRASSTVTLGFSKLRVPRANLIGEPGTGLTILQSGLNKSRPSVAAHLLGIARAALDDILEYGNSRQVRGKSLLQYQVSQIRLADAATELALCHSLLWQVAKMDPSEPEFSLLSAMLKLRASEVALAITEASLQMHGGAGYCCEFRAERLVRDARLGPIGEGASEVLRDLIGRTLSGARSRARPRDGG